MRTYPVSIEASVRREDRSIPKFGPVSPTVERDPLQTNDLIHINEKNCVGQTLHGTKYVELAPDVVFGGPGLIFHFKIGFRDGIMSNQPHQIRGNESSGSCRLPYLKREKPSAVEHSK